MNKLKAGVIFGGMSTEHDVSISSGTSIIKNLSKEKYEILSKKLPKFNPNILMQYETFEDEYDILDADCDSGACPVR